MFIISHVKIIRINVFPPIINDAILSSICHLVILKDDTIKSTGTR